MPVSPHLLVAFIPERGGSLKIGLGPPTIQQHPSQPGGHVGGCSGAPPLTPQHGAVLLAATDFGKAQMVWDLFSKIRRREIILVGKQNKPK